MSGPWNLGGDVAVVDGRETVELRPPGGGPFVPVPGALRRHVEQREVAGSGGGVVQEDITWHLPAAGLADTPRVGAELRDAAGVEWTVLDVAPEARATRWVCRARRVVFLAPACGPVTIERAEWTAGDDGGPLLAWVVEAAGVWARVQPVEGRVTVENDRGTHRVTHRVLVEGARTFTGQLRVTAAERVYVVEAWRAAESPVGPTELLAAEADWPLG